MLSCKAPAATAAIPQQGATTKKLEAPGGHPCKCCSRRLQADSTPATVEDATRALAGTLDYLYLARPLCVLVALGHRVALIWG